MENKLRVAFIQGRPHGHPAHMAYAKSVNADFYFVDNKIRYHDLANSGAIRRYASWFVSAITFPFKKYDIILSEEPYFMVGIMKWLKLLRRGQKIIALEATHTLYFLNANRYSPTTKKANIKLLSAYDAFICVGEFQKKLLQNLIGSENHAPIYTVFNGVQVDRFLKLTNITPNLQNYNILFIGAIPNQNRIWYKGLDLMLEAFERLKKRLPDLTFTIVGDYNKNEIEVLLDNHCPQSRTSVNFIGNTNNIEFLLANASLYLHCARGEAWGISITEAMAAGIIPIVSDCTGAMEVVEKIDARLITSLNVNDIEEKLIWYFNLSSEVKSTLSKKAKKIIEDQYTEDKAVEYFRNTFLKAAQLLADH